MLSSEAIYDRTVRLIGTQAMDRLKQAHVLIVGLGGVGGHCLEAIARSGVGKITLIDFDRVDPSNLNRQLLSGVDQLGQLKTELGKARVQNINPYVDVSVMSLRLTPDNIDRVLSDVGHVTLLVDCIDQIESKCALLVAAYHRQIRVFSSMGAGWRLNPSLVKIADIAKTTHCPLARRIRQHLKSVGITSGITTVFSMETAQKPKEASSPVGSISHMPALFGTFLAGAAISFLLDQPCS